MARHQQTWKPRKYRATHASVNDGSTAMVQAQAGAFITLMNEDGHVWTDRSDQWEAITRG